MIFLPDYNCLHTRLNIVTVSTTATAAIVPRGKRPAPLFSYPSPRAPHCSHVAYPFKPPRVIVRLHVTNSGNSDVAFVCCLHKSISLQRQKLICMQVVVCVCVCVLPLCLTFHSICQPRPLYSYILRPQQLPGVLYAFHFTLPVSKHFIPFFSSFPRFSTYTYIHMYFFFAYPALSIFPEFFQFSAHATSCCVCLPCWPIMVGENGGGWDGTVWYGMWVLPLSVELRFYPQKTHCWHEQNLVLVSQFLTVVWLDGCGRCNKSSYWRAFHIVAGLLFAWTEFWWHWNVDWGVWNWIHSDSSSWGL